MNNTYRQPKFFYLDIICILLAGVLVFSFFEPTTEEIVETDDWLLYDRYVEIMVLHYSHQHNNKIYLPQPAALCSHAGGC